MTGGTGTRPGPDQSTIERHYQRLRREAEAAGYHLHPDADFARMLARGLLVWRCQVCGYLCARGSPPEVCPICRAERDRLERFL